VQVGIPRPIAGVGADLIQRAIMELPDGVRIPRLESAEL
jgi:hypothetical protein